MRYTVLWVRRAEEDLAAIWTGAANRNAIASAANTIDALLREDPESRGESRQGALRILFVPPLGVDFEVFEEDRLVRVLGVWTTAR
jgi:plasmid stabilization system protein ParE